MADFRPAQDNKNLRRGGLERRYDFRHLGRVPNIHAKTGNFGVLRQNRFDHVDRPLLEVKLKDFGARAQTAQVRRQIPQPESAVDILRVERA